MDKLGQPIEYGQYSFSSEVNQVPTTLDTLISQTGARIAEYVQQLVANVSPEDALKMLSTVDLLQPLLPVGTSPQEHVIFDSSSLSSA